MNHFDQAARYAAQAEPHSLVQRVMLPTGLTSSFREWLDTRTVSLPGGPNRTADLVAAVDDADAQPLALLFEFQSQHDAEKIDVSLLEAIAHRMQLRNADNQRGKYRVVPVLVYLVGRCPMTELRMTVGGFGIVYKPLVWNVCDDDATTTLEAVASGALSWAMLFWTSLTQGADDPEVVSRWREVVTQVVADERRRAELSAVVQLFAELAGRAVIWERGLEGFIMTESTLVKKWIAQGEARGSLQTLQNVVIDLLEANLAEPPPAEIVQLVKEQESMDLLRIWTLAASKARTLEEFTRTLRG